MDLHLTGKRAIVTGASRGIGLAIADALASEGCDVAICARRAGPLEAAAGRIARHGTRVFPFPCDLADPAAIEHFMHDAAEALGGLDILVNNPSGMGLQDDEESWKRGIDIDLLALVRTSRLALPLMERAGGGAILHISSISGIGKSSDKAYGAVKAAVNHYTASQASDYARLNIRVNAVAPGSIYFEGGFWDDIRRDEPDSFQATLDGIPFGRMGTPEEIAAAAVFLCSDQASWITGQTVIVDGGQLLG